MLRAREHHIMMRASSVVLATSRAVELVEMLELVHDWPTSRRFVWPGCTLLFKIHKSHMLRRVDCAGLAS